MNQQIMQDQSIVQELVFLYNNDPSTYLNIRRLVKSAYKNSLSTHAEKTFLRDSEEGHRCFGVLVDREEDFAKYLEMPFHPTAFYYIFCRVDYPFAAVFAVNPKGHIVEKKSLFQGEEINDILHTFGYCLGRCSPSDFVNKIAPEEKGVTILEGCVSHAV